MMKKGLIVIFTSLLVSVGSFGTYASPALAAENVNPSTNVQVSTVNTVSGFKDVKADHWAKSSIDAAVGKGYFKGYSDGTFKPNVTVSRSEFAALLARVSKADVKEEKDIFQDLKEHWSEAEVNRAVSLGFIDPNDYKGGFEPKTAITRAEIAKWMTSGLAAADTDYKQALEDTKKTVIPVKEYFNPGIPESKSSHIAVALGTKLMNGYPDGSFGLDKHATRAEASAILLNLERVSEKTADSFIGLRELREVGTKRTNMEVISPFTTGGTSLNDVAEKTLTFRNYAGSVQLHHYIVVDTQDLKNIKGIYAPLFVDESEYKNRLNEPGIYRAFIQITIYPKAKDFAVAHYKNGLNAGVVSGSAIINDLPQKFGYIGLPNLETKKFFEKYNNEKGVTLWVLRLVNVAHPQAQITTDDGSFASIRNN
ncbi:S-layer homology domain-containing protein [Paenibacillus sp. FA6]|uniref:S-layer homology domain-containing protein n=1 Tax=Paenibacillus sp. FA6 TaxID=3413029 RepID=UPI003F65E250